MENASNQKVETVQGVREVFGNMPGAAVAGGIGSAVPEKNPAAVALGSKAYGKPKTLTDEERARRSEHIKRVTADRVAARAAKRAAGTQAPSPAPVVAGPVVPAANRVQAKSSVRYVSRGVVAPSSRAYPAGKTR